MYKTFKIDYDLLAPENVWSLNDYIYSIFQLDAVYSPVDNLFKRYVDMKIRTITPTDIISDAVDYYSPRYIRFYDNHLDNYGNNLIVKTNNSIKSPIVMIGNKKYVSNMLGDNISQINYAKTIVESITIKNALVNMQMTLELQ
jgi:hypothetical protein